MADEEQKTGALASWIGGAGLPAADKNAVAEALAQSAEAGGTGDGDTVYLSFSGQGANYAGWKMGRDRTSPDPDAIFILDPFSAVEGWTCWKGGSVAEKHEWSAFERKTQAVPQSQLKDHGPYADGDGWSFMLGISMFDIDEPGKKITFTSTSKSGKNTIADLTKEMAARIVADEPEIPVIRLDSETFVAQGKTNGKPLMPVEGWVSRAEVETFLNMGEDGDLEDLLAGNYAGAEEAEAEPEPEPEEKPKRKRRTRKKAA